MKTLAKLSLFQALILLFPLVAPAQTALDFSYSASSHAQAIVNASPLGRDFWFAVPQNFSPTLDPTRFYYIYISSSKNTTAHIQVGNTSVLTRSIVANVTTTVSSVTNDFSKQVELQSSGIAENKTIHVWSEDADLSVMFLSRAPFTTDGMYCLPSSGWGKDYAVASYTSFLIDAKYGDFPSEFVVVANQNNTTISITPSTDVRQDGFPGTIAHKKDSTFSVTLMRGECMEFQATATPLDETWDYSGTRIHADKPIGVIGASVCPNIAPADNTCDHILEMLPPIRAWGSHYITLPFDGRKYGGDGFLLLGTKPSQVINRNGAQAAALATTTRPTYLYDIAEGSEWTSNEPFMLVQYVMSASHGVPNGGQRNTGDPAMVVISPVEQFSQATPLQIPELGGTLAGGQLDFTNYLNILVPLSHEALTMIDGKSLGAIAGTSIKKYTIGTNGWEGIQLKYNQAGAGAGPHLITSDTTVGVYSYGYTRDDSYAWPGSLGTRSLGLLDTIAPTASMQSTDCFSGTITVRDLGANASKLQEIITDSVYNMTFTPWPDTFIAVGDDSDAIAVKATDQSMESYARLIVTDLAGNRSTVTLTAPSINRGLIATSGTSGSFSVGIPDTLRILLSNTSRSAVDISDLKLDPNGDAGFLLLSGFPSSLAAGDSTYVTVTFNSSTAGSYSTHLLLDATCTQFSAALSVGTGSVVQGFDMPCVIIGSTGSDSIRVTNLRETDLSVDSIWTSDPQRFSVMGVYSHDQPWSIRPGATGMAAISYSPTMIEKDTAIAYVRMSTGSTLSARITACAIDNGSVRDDATAAGFAALPVLPNPASLTQRLTFRYTLANPATLSLTLFDELGRTTAIVIEPHVESAGTHSVEYAVPAGFSAGTYYYRYGCGSSHISGKLIIQ